MPSFMLDTNAIQYIGSDDIFLKKVIAAVENGKITLYITHIQLDEIKNIPDSNANTRSKLLEFVETYCTRVPTMGMVLGVSALGEARLSDGNDIDTIQNGKLKMICDALITATAKIDADFLVTNDKILRNRILKKLPNLSLLTVNEFYQFLI